MMGNFFKKNPDDQRWHFKDNLSLSVYYNEEESNDRESSDKESSDK